MKKLFYILPIFILAIGIEAKAQEKSKSVQYSSVKEYEIGGIRVEGTQYLDGSALISLTGLKIGDRIKIPGEF